MNTITINDITINYIVRKTTKKRIYIRVKEGIVYLSVTKKTTPKEVEGLIKKHINFIQKALITNQKQDVIHVNGIAYKPLFNLGDKNSISFEGNVIVITSKKNDMKSYEKILKDFYKKEVLNVLNTLINEAKLDFMEVKFPTISVSYLKSVFGSYNRKKHHIKISAMLGKYDYSFIKLVLYHELSHIFEFNHSKKYYEVFESKYPNAKKLNFMLKKIKYHDCI